MTDLQFSLLLAGIGFVLIGLGFILRTLVEIARMLGCPSVGHFDTVASLIAAVRDSQPTYNWTTTEKTTTTRQPVGCGKKGKKP